jgi:hypothetical protein
MLAVKNGWRSMGGTGAFSSAVLVKAHDLGHNAAATTSSGDSMMRCTRMFALLAAVAVVGALGVGAGPASATGSEGCTPGYWKNHQDSWAASGYDPDQTVESVFNVPGSLAPLGDATLLEALAFKGGPGKIGAARILLRAAVAGLLNISNPTIDYGGVKATFINRTNAALASGTRAKMLNLAAEFDDRNNQGTCPLN